MSGTLVTLNPPEDALLVPQPVTHCPAAAAAHALFYGYACVNLGPGHASNQPCTPANTVSRLLTAWVNWFAKIPAREQQARVWKRACSLKDEALLVQSVHAFDAVVAGQHTPSILQLLHYALHWYVSMRGWYSASGNQDFQQWLRADARPLRLSADALTAVHASGHLATAEQVRVFMQALVTHDKLVQKNMLGVAGRCLFASASGDGGCWQAEPYSLVGHSPAPLPHDYDKGLRAWVIDLPSSVEVQGDVTPLFQGRRIALCLEDAGKNSLVLFSAATACQHCWPSSAEEWHDHLPFLMFTKHEEEEQGTAARVMAQDETKGVELVCVENDEQDDADGEPYLVLSDADEAVVALLPAGAGCTVVTHEGVKTAVWLLSTREDSVILTVPAAAFLVALLELTYSEKRALARLMHRAVLIPDAEGADEPVDSTELLEFIYQCLDAVQPAKLQVPALLQTVGISVPTSAYEAEEAAVQSWLTWAAMCVKLQAQGDATADWLVAPIPIQAAAACQNARFRAKFSKHVYRQRGGEGVVTIMQKPVQPKFDARMVTVATPVQPQRRNIPASWRLRTTRK